jgi:methylisocitrate lyase
MPLVYVMSRGNRDGRPIYTRDELRDMGWVAIIDAQVMMPPAFVAQQRMLEELRATGAYAGMTNDEAVRARNAIEDVIGLEEHYEIERQTVEVG